MALYPLALDLATARSLQQVQGRCALLSAWTVNATVIPQLALQDPSGTTRTLLVTLPLSVQTPLLVVSVSNAIGSGTLYLLMSDDPCDSIAVGASGALGVAYAADNYDLDVMWPYPLLADASAGVWNTGGVARAGAVPTSWPNLWGFAAGAGSSTMFPMLADTAWMGGQLTAARGIALSGFPLYLLHTIPAGVPADWSLPAESRVWRISYTWRQAVGNPGLQDGFGFTWCGGAMSNYQQGSIWLAGNGAGAIQIVAYGSGVAGVVTYTFPVAWPVAITVPVNIEWALFSANGVLPGRMELWLNGSRMWGRSFTDGGMPLPVHTATPPGIKLVPFVSLSTAGNQVRIANLRIRQGRFDHYGVEV